MKRLICLLLGHRWSHISIANINQYKFRCQRCRHERWVYAAMHSVGNGEKAA